MTRSFQLTQKSGGKLEKKDLDQVIQTLDAQTGEKVSVSKKCADINATVPDMMGVSKAILENVVFVHQEDSNWPLGDAAMLKKKFDEIFSATKYTKALEHINKLKKDQAVIIRESRMRRGLPDVARHLIQRILNPLYGFKWHPMTWRAISARPSHEGGNAAGAEGPRGRAWQYCDRRVIECHLTQETMVQNAC